MKKQGNEVALRQSASLAALAWSRLEAVGAGDAERSEWGGPGRPHGCRHGRDHASRNR